jgi:hypothetical protein
MAVQIDLHDVFGLVVIQRGKDKRQQVVAGCDLRGGSHCGPMVSSLRCVNVKRQDIVLLRNAPPMLNACPGAEPP